MKKLFFFAALFVAASFTTVNAQSCAKKTAGASCCASTKAAMAKAVSNDASIEKRVCAVSGKEAYYRNETCAVSGKTTSTEVVFDAKQNVFVNVSPTRADMPAAEGTTKKACTAAEKAACAKSCSKAGKAACGVKSSKQANVQNTDVAPAQAKMVKGEN